MLGVAIYIARSSLDRFCVANHFGAARTVRFPFRSKRATEVVPENRTGC